MKPLNILSERSLKRLEGVNDDLRQVVIRASQISLVDFTVLEGLRSLTRQAQLLKVGATTTLKSRHLTGHAVDLAPLDDGAVSWHWPHFFPLADAMKNAAAELKIPLEWGGDWRTFKDGPHFQLPWKQYPD